MSDKKKLLWISDSPAIPFVGQSVVSRECLLRLQEHYNVEALGFAHSDCKDPIKLPFPVIDCSRQDMHDPEKISKLIENSNPDVVLMSHDPWILPTIGHLKYKYPKIKFIGYVTVDGEPCYHGWRHYLKPYDLLISPSKFTATAIKDRWIDMDVDHVPYGVDFKYFHVPSQGKIKLKQELADAYSRMYGSWLDLSNKFVGVFVGANQDRKNLGLIHAAWKQFEQGKEKNVMLVMVVHSASLREDVGTYDLAVFTFDSKTIRIINIPQPIEVIGQFMACADVLVHPCAGEGFGLTIYEAMACGTVPVILNYAAATDVCNESNSYPVPFIKHVGGYHVNRALSTPENLAEALENAYQDQDGRLNRAMNAINTVPNFTWDNCAAGLKKSIDKVLGFSEDLIRVKRVV